MNRISPIVGLVALLVTLSTLFASACAADKPNIVYILVDNWGWGDIAIQGSSTPTPRIDAFAREGLRFTNFNIQNQCTPTRSAIHTGRLPIRSGTWKVAAPGEPQGMAPWEYTIAELLSDAGYATAMYGKWHIGDRDGRLPNDQGYDEWYGTKESAMEASFTSTPQFDPKVYPIPHIWAGKKGEASKKVKPFNLKSRTFLDREVVEKTAAFVKRQAKQGKPFCPKSSPLEVRAILLIDAVVGGLVGIFHVVTSGTYLFRDVHRNAGVDVRLLLSRWRRPGIFNELHISDPNVVLGHVPHYAVVGQR